MSNPELAAGAPVVRQSVVPSDPVAARAFLQVRVQTYLSVAFGLWALAFGFDRAIDWTTHKEPLAGSAALYLYMHGVALAVLAMFYVVVRSGPRHAGVLRFIETFASVIQAALGATLLGQLPLAVRPEMMAVFAATLILMLRTGLVPGSARVALGVGVLCMAPSILLTFWLYSTRAPVPGGLDRPTALAYIAEWSVIALFSTTAIHAVVYGLRERVQELGQYTLLHKIGEGGMGIVYRARHSLLRRATAVKVLPVERLTVLGIARFEREVQLTAELAHPNIVSVYDFGRSADGSFYYAMEYLDGIDLQRLVEETGPLPEARAVHFLLQAADALAEAHAIDLIHRDIKPANLLASNPARRPDHLTVLDFGLAKNFSDGNDNPDLSDVRSITGSPLYMSPESILEPASVDGRSDLYALGAVAYWLLTGTPPFTGNSVVEVCASHVHKQLEPPSQRVGRVITPALEALVVACLAKDRADRPASAALLLERLRALGLGEWTHELARAWWSEHAAAVPRAAETSIALTRTLMIAPRGDERGDD